MKAYRLRDTNVGSLIALSSRRLRNPVYPFPVALAFSKVSGEIRSATTGFTCLERRAFASAAISAYCSGVSSGGFSSGMIGLVAAASEKSLLFSSLNR